MRCLNQEPSLEGLHCTTNPDKIVPEHVRTSPMHPRETTVGARVQAGFRRLRVADATRNGPTDNPPTPLQSQVGWCHRREVCQTNNYISYFSNPSCKIFAKIFNRRTLQSMMGLNVYMQAKNCLSPSQARAMIRAPHYQKAAIMALNVSQLHLDLERRMESGKTTFYKPRSQPTTPNVSHYATPKVGAMLTWFSQIPNNVKVYATTTTRRNSLT